MFIKLSSYEGGFKENIKRILLDSKLYLDMKPVSKWTAFCRGLKGSIGSPSSGASLTRMKTPTIPRYRRSPDTGAGICLYEQKKLKSSYCLKFALIGVYINAIKTIFLFRFWFLTSILQITKKRKKIRVEYMNKPKWCRNTHALHLFFYKVQLRNGMQYILNISFLASRS